MLLSHRLWESRYGQDASIVGKPVRVDDLQRVVIGVMPAGAQFPEDTDVWTPLTLADLANPAFRNDLQLFGRLAGNTTLSAAQTEFDALTRPPSANMSAVRWSASGRFSK